MNFDKKIKLQKDLKRMQWRKTVKLPYRPDSRIRELIVRVYEEQTGKKAKICSIHAGLECGILADKLPGLDCVSYGPQMQAIHTTGETLSISSVQRTWELTLGVLAAIK